MSHTTDVLTYINRMKHVSFAELCKQFKWFNGNLVMVSGYNENIIYWCDLSNEAIDIVTELLTTKLLVMDPSPTMVYLIDGIALDLPIVTPENCKKIKRPHWLPIVFNPKA